MCEDGTTRGDNELDLFVDSSSSARSKFDRSSAHYASPQDLNEPSYVMTSSTDKAREQAQLLYIYMKIVYYVCIHIYICSKYYTRIS